MLGRFRRWTSGAGLWRRAPDPTVCFDVCDLIAHFGNARTPTGIQRVQIEIVTALLRGPNKAAIRICSFSEQRGCWAHVPNALFLRLCDLSIAGGNSSRVWNALLRVILWQIRLAPPMRFARGSALVNLGTSWWLRNYALSVRDAKAAYGIRYIPFVHDLIPLVAPQYCIAGLAQDFTAWLSAAFEDADHFLVNSQSTRTDLLSAAKRLGHEALDDVVTVVPLDGDFRQRDAAEHGSEQIYALGLTPRDYVLFVSTIEVRKNHLGAFSAWLALIGKRGAANTPTLVCVGNEGWLNAEVHAKLDASEVLRSRVIMLSNLPDTALASFYDNCLFTFYPSHYEGWGLPVTESLCHGKVPLVSTASSLPEAGGPFADYFEAGSEASMVAALERLIFDPAYRARKEAFIHESFRPRRWIEIGAQIVDAAARMSRT
jgi:glycosyltransferase involved in cell wall biosynthesis